MSSSNHEDLLAAAKAAAEMVLAHPMVLRVAPAQAARIVDDVLAAVSEQINKGTLASKQLNEDDLANAAFVMFVKDGAVQIYKPDEGTFDKVSSIDKFQEFSAFKPSSVASSDVLFSDAREHTRLCC
jgi:hypothetical protein